jgi:hypothetical protein
MATQCENCDNRFFDDNGEHSEQRVRFWYNDFRSHDPRVKIEVTDIGQKIRISEDELYIKKIIFWN